MYRRHGLVSYVLYLYSKIPLPVKTRAGGHKAPTYLLALQFSSHSLNAYFTSLLFTHN